MTALGGVAGVTTVQCGFKDACVVGGVTITEQNRGGGLVLWTPGVVFAHILTVFCRFLNFQEALLSEMQLNQQYTCIKQTFQWKSYQSKLFNLLVYPCNAQCKAIDGTTCRLAPVDIRPGWKQTWLPLHSRVPQAKHDKKKQKTTKQSNVPLLHTADPQRTQRRYKHKWKALQCKIPFRNSLPWALAVLAAKLS